MQPENRGERALNLDVSGGQSFARWRESLEGNIDMDHQENMEKSKTTIESLREKWGLGG